MIDELFTAQSRRPATLASLVLTELAPFHRALLVADGTVTQLIEAYTLEPVEVRCVRQQERLLAAGHPWLELEPGAGVLCRQVVLRGAVSAQVRALAHSSIVVDRLPASVQVGLERRDKGVGRLLIESRLESRRQLLWYGLQRDESQCFLSRTYRLWTGGVPAMVITERFPLEESDGTRALARPI